MRIFWLDLPDPNAKEEDTPWINYQTYFSKKAAVKALSDIWGIDKKYSDLFITKGDV